MMNRREMLVRMLGAAVAATVIPLVDLADATPAFWNQAPLRGLLPWRVVFPDGLFCTFDGTVVAEKLLDDGTVSLTVRPQSVKFDQDASVVGPKPVARPTTLSFDGSTAELLDIELPEQTAAFPLGRGALTFTVKF